MMPFSIGLPFPQTVPNYKPSWLVRNPHVQTILGNFLSGKPVVLPNFSRIIPLNDGDALAVLDSIPTDWSPTRSIVIMVHGLGGNAHSGTIARPAAMLFEKGLRVVRVNMRGAGEGKGHARKPYNGGCSADIRSVVHAYRSEFPNTPIQVMGVSLGGNIVLKLAGEDGKTGDTSVTRYATINPPADLDACCTLLEKRANRLYEWKFVQNLKILATERSVIYSEAIPVFPKRTRLRQFDDLYTAPRCGYSGVAEYYQDASSISHLKHIATPTLIITSQDDPFIDPVPLQNLSDPVQLVLLKYGGHLGYLQGLRSQPRMAEKLASDWLANLGN